jgi:hypothetical protein
MVMGMKKEIKMMAKEKLKTWEKTWVKRKWD